VQVTISAFVGFMSGNPHFVGLQVGNPRLYKQGELVHGLNIGMAKLSFSFVG
jgi:hypothetical protein